MPLGARFYWFGFVFQQCARYNEHWIIKFNYMTHNCWIWYWNVDDGLLNKFMLVNWLLVILQLVDFGLINGCSWMKSRDALLNGICRNYWATRNKWRAHYASIDGTSTYTVKGIIKCFFFVSPVKCGMIEETGHIMSNGNNKLWWYQ